MMLMMETTATDSILSLKRDVLFDYRGMASNRNCVRS